jgi:uncharacterized protein (TIGR02145 family)
MSQIESQFLYLKNFLPILNIKKRKKYCKELGNIFKNIISDPNVLFDERDYSLYSIIKIGNQTWMAENLRYDIESSRLNPMNPSIEYGKLYNWNTVMKATPKGWHLPSDSEWNELEMALGMPAVDVTNTGNRGTDHGTKMKSTTGWNSSGNGTNTSGFNAFPAGFYDSGSFYRLGGYAFFWSSTEFSGSFAWYRSLYSGNATVYRYNYNKTYGFSCRCVKD